MAWIVGFLTVVLVLDCLFLILLILVQLPKKEAGIGQAFGASATDALFGAGSGTALTKITKYSTGVFLGLTFLLAILNANLAKNDSNRFEQQLNEAAKAITPPTPPATPGTPATPPATQNTAAGALAAATNVAAAATNLLLTASSNVEAAVTVATNLLTSPATNTTETPK